MLDSLTLKPDFAEAAARYESWWLCQNLDRPAISLPVKPTREPKLPVEPPTLRERWMDADYTFALAEARLSCRPWLAETFPVHHPNVGPDLTATIFGCDLEFGDHTSWVQHRYHSAEDWEAFLLAEPDFENAYWVNIVSRMAHSIDRSQGRFLTGLPDLHGSYDMLASIRSPEGVCYDLMDAPELVHRAGLHAADAYVQAYKRTYRLLAEVGQGSSTWCPLWHDGPAYVSSCDFLCLVSPEIASTHILPTILKEVEFTERSIFHLDGPDALHHLDLILSIDRIQALQWVYGAGAGPVTRWIDTYRRALEAGRAVQVICETIDDAIEMAGHLGSAGVWLTIGEEVETEEAAQELIKVITAKAHNAPPRR
jgi:hypothetical protein